MDLTLTEDQQAIVAATRDLLADRATSAQVRATFVDDSSIDPELWRACAAMGWFGFGLPAEAGGAGYGLVDETLLLREAGRALVTGPLVATMLGARVAHLAGMADLTAAIVAGDAPVALVVSTQPAERGAPVLVADLPGAALVLAAAPDRVALHRAVDLVDVEPGESLDEASRIAEARLPVDAVAEFADDVGELWLRGSVLIAAQLAGLCAGARDMAVLQAKQREQFGAPIGVHQAVKHRCADMAVRTEAAECLVSFAALAVDDGRPDAAEQVAAARIIAGDGALTSARENIQIHGGMGFTFECDAHLFLKRAHHLDRMFGGPAVQRTVLVPA